MVIARRFPVGEWSLESTIEQFMSERFKDGDLISHEWLKWALDINQRDMQENEFLLLERMELFKAELLTVHQVALQNVRGRGYRIVPPAEQARFAAEEAARYMKKGFRKADSLLTHTRRDVLSSDERKRHTDTEIRLASLKGMASKGRRDVFALFNPS